MISDVKLIKTWFTFQRRAQHPPGQELGGGSMWTWAIIR
jgi:hypothetical protein